MKEIILPVDKTTDDFFAGKRVVVFIRAFIPTCSTYHHGFENNAQQFYDKGIDEIYCIFNDSFVMNWAATVRAEGLRLIKVIPDGNAEFTEGMDMLACFTALGFVSSKVGVMQWL